jgi:N utilization substance protein B
MNRREARETMMKIFYQLDVSGDFRTPFEESLKHDNLGSQEAYCRAVYEAVCSHKEDIDCRIDASSIKWKVERMAKTDIATIRLATGEILYLDDIPVAVSINEAIELARKYGTDQSPRFVNAVLGNIAKEQEQK